jgi:hypothetical protein
LCQTVGVIVIFVVVQLYVVFFYEIYFFLGMLYRFAAYHIWVVRYVLRSTTVSIQHAAQLPLARAITPSDSYSI